MNIIDCISDKSGFLDYIIYAAPFIILAIVTLLLRNKKIYRWNALLYAFIGIGTIFGNDIGNYSGAVFILFSVYIFNTRLTNIILISIMVISIVAKNVFFGYGITNTVNLFIVYLFIFLIYYILIHPKTDNKITVICPELDAETLKILQKLYEGCSVKDISDMVYLTQDAVSKRIGRARNTMGAKTTAHLLAICRENGYIRYNLDNPRKSL